jgi:hypothetical protein
MKVYEGHRIPDFNTFLKNVHTIGQQKVYEVYDRALLTYLTESYPERHEKWKEFQEAPEPKHIWTRFIDPAQRALTKAFQDQYFKYERNIYDLSLGLFIWFWQGKILTTPYSGLGLLWRETERMAFLQELGAVNYAYWNNSDPDEDVPEKEWEERKEAWSSLPDMWPCMRLELISPMNLWEIDAILTRERQDKIITEVPGRMERDVYYTQAFKVVENREGRDYEQVRAEYNELIAKSERQAINFDYLIHWIESDKQKAAEKAAPTQEQSNA